MMCIFEVGLASPERENNSSCATSEYGCCPDGRTAAVSLAMENCVTGLAYEETPCENTEYGCCSDDMTAAKGPFKEGCVDLSCRETANGCCDDGVTPAKLLDKTDCPRDCSQSLYGCCPDGKTAARGIGHAGCTENNFSLSSSIMYSSCAQTEFGCCDDGFTPARGPDRENCPDYVIDLNEPVSPFELTDKSQFEQVEQQKVMRYTEISSGLDRPDCSRTKFECCPDGVTPANVRTILSTKNLLQEKNVQMKKNYFF